jgi:uracil phosphoribosyltransferase
VALSDFTGVGWECRHYRRLINMDRIILKASDLDGFLAEQDKEIIKRINGEYDRAIESFKVLSGGEDKGLRREATNNLIAIYNRMGKIMQEIVAGESRIHVYSFETPERTHGEASRLIAKLRDTRTENPEFIYYTQRAYELLFNLAYGGNYQEKKNYMVVSTPVDIPVQNYAVHKIPDIDESISNSVMCVMLRGALLPAMIMSKEIQEYSSNNYITPFALFKISRDDTKEEHNMEYILNLKRSYFDLELLQGKDLIFADPMNATGGSLVTIVKYLLDQNIKPKSISFFNVISVLKGALRIVRAIDNVQIYTIWMDPVLNQKAYILPGLGDAGDRINGIDRDDSPRNIMQLIADYGANIAKLYRDQLRKVEETVLGS